nr:matrixin family metalloprotease [Bacillus sp. AFS053548]
MTLWHDFPELTADKEQKEVLAHEVGHSLGLKHEDDVPSIMYETKLLGSIYPTADDWAGIRARY